MKSGKNVKLSFMTLGPDGVKSQFIFGTGFAPFWEENLKDFEHEKGSGKGLKLITLTALARHC